MRWMLLAAASAMLPACLLFTSLDDASGGADPTSDGGGSDAAEATTTNDGSTGGSGDGASSSDARFCDQDGGAGLVFCADFEGATLAEGWTGLSGGAGELVLDQKAMLAKVPTTVEYTDGTHVFRDIDGDFTSLSCSFAFRREVLGQEDVIIAALATETNGDAYSAYLYDGVTAGQLLEEDYPADGGDPAVASASAGFGFPIGEWHRLTIEATKTEVHAYIDGKLEATLPHETSAKPLRTRFKLGQPEISDGNTKPWELRFDDVRCNRIP